MNVQTMMARILKGRTAAEVAAELKVSTASVNRLKNGKQEPRLSTWRRIEAAYARANGDAA